MLGDRSGKREVHMDEWEGGHRWRCRREKWMDGSMPMYKRRCEESRIGEHMISGLVGIAMVFLFVECAPHL